MNVPVHTPGTRHARNLRESEPAGTPHAHPPAPLRPWRLRLVFLALLGIAAFYLIAEHRAHLLGGLDWLPLLLLAMCPLLHVFGHGRHGGHGGHRPPPPRGGDLP